MVIEADSELTVKAGGSFIRLDASGIAISGPLARINAGGAPGSGSGIAIKMPRVPGMADQDSSGAGVQVLGIVEDQSSLMPRYEPNHPAADANGYVYYPNVNVVEEMADMISASRAFQTNAEMMNTAKQMMQKVLTLGQ